MLILGPIQADSIELASSGPDRELLSLSVSLFDWAYLVFGFWLEII